MSTSEIERLERKIEEAEEALLKLKREILEQRLKEVFSEYKDLGSISWQNLWGEENIYVDFLSIEIYDSKDTGLKNKECQEEVVSVLEAVEECTLLEILDKDGTVVVVFDRNNDSLQFHTEEI
jgi:hypothetical protein